MLTYIIRRVLGMFAVLFAVSVITYGMAAITPGGPWDVASSRPIPKAVQDSIKKKFGGDKDPFTRYVDYMSGVILRADLGPSLFETRSVNKIIADTFPVSAAFGLGAIAISLFLGVPMGLYAALRHNSWFDQFAMLLVTIGVSIPRFVLALAGIVLFSVVLTGFLPTRYVANNPASWIMPLVMLALGPLALVLRLVRSQTLEVLSEDYIRTARAKGLKPSVVNMRHIMRNALLPVVTLIGIITANLITGTFIVESIFSIPGSGKYSISAVSKRDYSVLMGITLFYTTIIVVANLLVDIAYGFIDPRIART